MRPVNHSQTQKAWCVVLQVESCSIHSRDRDEGSLLVDNACEVHLTDRNLVEKSGRETVPSSPLNIIAAVNHSLEHCGTTKLNFEVENGQSTEGSFEMGTVGGHGLFLEQEPDF